MVDHYWLCSEHFQYRTLVRMLLSMIYSVKVFVNFRTLSEHFEEYCLSSVLGLMDASGRFLGQLLLNPIELPPADFVGHPELSVSFSSNGAPHTLRDDTHMTSTKVLIF